MRFSLKWLLVAIAFVGVSLVALLNANSAWQDGFENFVLLLILTGTAGIVCLKHEPRMFSFGFVLFGMTYFVLAAGFFGFNRDWRLLPTMGLSYIHEHTFEPKKDVIPPGVSVDGDVLPGAFNANDGSRHVTIIRPSLRSFQRVGNAIFCIPFGLIGGFIASHLYRRSRKESDFSKEAKQ